MNLKESVEDKIRREKEKLQFSWRWDFPIPTILVLVLTTGKSIFDSWKDHLPGTTDWLDLFIENYVTKGNVAFFIIWAVILSIFFSVIRRNRIYSRVMSLNKQLIGVMQQEIGSYSNEESTSITVAKNVYHTTFYVNKNP